MASKTVPALGASLQADLRLVQAVSEFARILDDTDKQRFRELQTQLSVSAPSAADVISLTEELNREGAKRHASWRPAAGARLGGFLRRLQQFAAFGDVFIGGSQNLIATGVWAAVRAMLEVFISRDEPRRTPAAGFAHSLQGDNRPLQLLRSGVAAIDAPDIVMVDQPRVC